MGLETGTFVDDLVTSNPVGATDDIKKGDDHLRLIKSVLKATFPNATKAFRFESVLTKTSAYPVVAADARALILGDASSGAFTITLPLGSTVFAGYTVIIMKSESSSNDVTVDGNGAETINGSLTRTLTSQYQGEKYAWDGSEWKVIAINGLVDDSVTFAKMQNITTARLLGRTTAGSGDTEEIAIDGTMALSSLTLGVKALGVDTAQLAASAVETTKINNLAVTTAKIAANAVNGTKIALGSDAQGDVMYYNGTAYVRLAKGTSGQFLKQGATIPAWATLAALTRHTAIATTSGTTHDFTGLDAGLNRIVCMFSGVSLDGTDELQIRLGDSVGFESSGYISTASVSGGDDQSTTAFVIQKSNAAVDVWHGLVIFARQDGNTWEMSGSITAGGNNHSWCSGGKTLSAELTQLRLMTTGSNSFDAGSFNIITE